MRKKIFHNWGLKLGSVVIAFVLWLLVVQIYDPKDTRVFYGVPVTLTNTELLDQQDKVYEVLDGTDTIRVTVRAPRSVINELRASDIVAEADMSKLTEINTITISCYVLNNDVDTISSNPDVLRLTVEDRSSNWVSVRYGTVGEVAEGYMVYDVRPDQTRIEVSGPESAVARVSYASVQIDVSGATTDVAANVDVLLYDKEDTLLELPNITKNVNYMRMEVEVLATKEVPINLSVMGTPADGYLETGVVSCDPASVMIAGTAAALTNVRGIDIPGEVLNISGATGNVTAVIDLEDYLVDNIRLADSSFDGRVTATVYIESEMERSFTVRSGEISVTNVPEGFAARLSETDELYEITVSGLADAVTSLQDTISGNADIASWMVQEGMEELVPGVYHIPVNFALPGKVVVKEPLLVQITVVKLED